MFEELLKHGIPALLGLLIGVGVMTWVSPTTAGGQVIIVLVTMVTVIVVAWAVRWTIRLVRRRNR